MSYFQSQSSAFHMPTEEMCTRPQDIHHAHGYMRHGYTTSECSSPSERPTNLVSSLRTIEALERDIQQNYFVNRTARRPSLPSYFTNHYPRMYQRDSTPYPYRPLVMAATGHSSSPERRDSICSSGSSHSGYQPYSIYRRTQHPHSSQQNQRRRHPLHVTFQDDEKLPERRHSVRPGHRYHHSLDSGRSNLQRMNTLPNPGTGQHRDDDPLLFSYHPSYPQRGVHNHGRPGPYPPRPSSAHSIRINHNYEYNNASIPAEPIYTDAEHNKFSDEPLSLTRSRSASSVSDASTDLLPGAPGFRPAEMILKYPKSAQPGEFDGRERGPLDDYPGGISIGGTEVLTEWSGEATKGSETDEPVSVTSSNNLYSNISAARLEAGGYAGPYHDQEEYAAYRDGEEVEDGDNDDDDNDDFESDEEYMSDGIASDEGDYYWSDDDRDLGDWEDPVHEEGSDENNLDEEGLEERFGRL